MLPNNHCIIEEVKKEIKKLLKTNENTMIQIYGMQQEQF